VASVSTFSFAAPRCAHTKREEQDLKWQEKVVNDYVADLMTDQHLYHLGGFGHMGMDSMEAPFFRVLVREAERLLRGLHPLHPMSTAVFSLPYLTDTIDDFNREPVVKLTYLL